MHFSRPRFYDTLCRKLRRLFRRDLASRPRATADPGIQPSAPVVTGKPTAGNPDTEPQTEPKPSSNPVWFECSSTLKTVVDRTFPEVLSPLKSTMETFLRWVDSKEEFENSIEEYTILASELKKTADFLAPQLDNPYCDSLSELIRGIVDSIADNFKVIEAEQKLICASDQGLPETQLHYKKIHECLTTINGALERLRRQIQTEILALATKAREDKLIDSLRPSQSALYDPNPQGIVRQYCAKDTRIEILDKLASWSNDSSSHLMWMNGMAGTGKTTIAYSFAKVLHDRPKPAASFFCSGVDPECREVSRIIPTIAYQLANLSPEFRRQLGDLLREAPSLAGLNDIPLQFTNLLKDPFKGVARGSNDIIVLIDALDECDDPGQVGSFLDHLAKCIEELPLKFLVTSRPEAWILRRMQPVQGPALAKSIIPLHEIDESLVQADIKLYLKQELEFMPLSDEQLDLLVGQCGTLFIYAATLVRYIKPMDDPVSSGERVINVLRLGTSFGWKHRKHQDTLEMHDNMNRLYSFVLDKALDSDLEDDERSKVQMVLKTILCAKEPISIKTTAVLCGLDDGQDTDDLSFTLERLRSVVYVSESSGLVSVFHASFPDFMFNKERSKGLFCDPAEHNHLMAEQCFGLMEELRFNICNLDSSYVSDDKATIQPRVDVIRPTLWYACRYWAEHLAQTKRSDLCERLQTFLSRRLLFWMEVLSLKRSITFGGNELLRASLWLRIPDVGAGVDLITLTEDARNFVTSFAANPISNSTPHIYTSLFSFCPRSSAVYKCYRECFQGLVEPDHRAMQLQEVAALASWKRHSVSSVAYSPDGNKIAFGCLDGTVGVQASHEEAVTSSTSILAHQGPVRSVAFSPINDIIGIHSYLASGSEDGTIRTWNIYTSDHEAPTLRSVCRLDSSPGKIMSIAFSPDGNIASGSSNGTVCIWDPRPSGPDGDGKLLQGPLREHTDEIWSVAYSPDGKYLASGSDDRTIRVWDPKTGQQVLDPLMAQEDDINSIDFSPDGERLASGSSDGRICVWNIPQRALALPPFLAHSNKVQAIKFSPDGNYIASSSLDRSIRVWDPRNGELIGGPFEGHIGPIYSIAFSPDSTRMISGSPDGTIQLWDPKKSALSKSLDYHTNGVASVAFSPNGHYVASCSYDTTLRVWDISDKNRPVPVGGPFRGHTRIVFSLAFSPDNTRVVTASVDGTARVWDIHNRTEPIIFKKHKGVVRSVAFAPDGSFIVSAGSDTTIQMWNPTDGEPISDPLEGHEKEIKSVTFSPDGASIASGSADKTVRVWNTGAENAPLHVLKGHTHIVWSVAYSPDGTKLVSSSSDGTIRLWDPKNGSLIREIKAYEEDTRIASVAFSPRSDYITWGAEDSIVQLCDLNKGDHARQSFKGHRGVIWSVVFSPDGTHIASGSHDGTIRIWDTQKRTPWRNGDDGAESDWVLGRDGWMKRGDDLLLWVPHEVARSLLTPHCRSVISSCGPLSLDLSNVALGGQWRGCLISQPVE